LTGDINVNECQEHHLHKWLVLMLIQQYDAQDNWFLDIFRVARRNELGNANILDS